MTVTSAQILQVVNRLGQGGTKGATEAIRRANRSAMNSSQLTPSQQDFLAAADRVPTAEKTAYVHPGTMAGSPPPQRPNEEPAPLAPSDIEWLRRLPADPADVPFSDAAALIGLTRRSLTPSDARLVRTVAAPVVEYHDKQQATADLANASVPLIAAPPETLAALADAISAENDQLQPDEAVLRAGNLLQENGQRRVSEHAQRRNDAMSRVTSLDAAATQRTAVHR